MTHKPLNHVKTNSLLSICVKLLSSLPVRPTFFRQEKQRFFFLFLSGVWSLSDRACAPSPTGSGEGKKDKQAQW